MTSPDWPNLLRTSNPGLSVEHEIGQAHAPDSLDGAVALRVHADGSLHLTLTRQDVVTEWTARVHPGSAAKLFRRLADRGVPDLPLEPFGPGPSRRFLVLRCDGAEAICELSRATTDRDPAWEPIIVWFDGAVERILGRELPEWLKRAPVVKDARRRQHDEDTDNPPMVGV
ncbi:MAG: hypothetical protein CMH57_06445 [Myxococcales bacterium]|nr:hypothetical protein [Myxococcales bacterium]